MHLTPTELGAKLVLQLCFASAPSRGLQCSWSVLIVRLCVPPLPQQQLRGLRWFTINQKMSRGWGVAEPFDQAPGERGLRV